MEKYEYPIQSTCIDKYTWYVSSTYKEGNVFDDWQQILVLKIAQLFYVRYGSSNKNTVPRPLPFFGKKCELQSDTQIRCETSPGAGKDHSWKLTVGLLTTGEIDMPNTGYLPPVIKDFVVYNNTEITVHDYKTAGGQFIEIDGSDFGPIPDASTYFYQVNISMNWGYGVDLTNAPSVFIPYGCSHTVPHKRSDAPYQKVLGVPLIGK